MWFITIHYYYYNKINTTDVTFGSKSFKRLNEILSETLDLVNMHFSEFCFCFFLPIIEPCWVFFLLYVQCGEHDDTSQWLFVFILKQDYNTKMSGLFSWYQQICPFSHIFIWTANHFLNCFVAQMRSRRLADVCQMLLWRYFNQQTSGETSILTFF